eukprot:Nk52_evm9s281 gene=Nk52_evmTU9s281
MSWNRFDDFNVLTSKNERKLKSASKSTRNVLFSNEVNEVAKEFSTPQSQQTQRNKRSSANSVQCSFSLAEISADFSSAKRPHNVSSSTPVTVSALKTQMKFQPPEKFPSSPSNAFMGSSTEHAPSSSISEISSSCAEGISSTPDDSLSRPSAREGIHPFRAENNNVVGASSLISMFRSCPASVDKKNRRASINTETSQIKRRKSATKKNEYLTRLKALKEQRDQEQQFFQHELSLNEITKAPSLHITVVSSRETKLGKVYMCTVINSFCSQMNIGQAVYVQFSKQNRTSFATGASNDDSLVIYDPWHSIIPFESEGIPFIRVYCWRKSVKL